MKNERVKHEDYMRSHWELQQKYELLLTEAKTKSLKLLTEVLEGGTVPDEQLVAATIIFSGGRHGS